MKNTFLCIVFSILYSFNSYAHQSQQSILIISQAKDEKYILQLNSSLSAFEGEINYLYPKSIYKTPEEFQKLVIGHIQRNFLCIVNEKDTLSIANPMLLLGHDTRFIAELVGIPRKITSICIKNLVFKDIPRNGSVVVLLLKGISEQHFLLHQENQHTLNIKRQANQWKIVKKSSLYDLRTTSLLRTIYLKVKQHLVLKFLRYFWGPLPRPHAQKAIASAPADWGSRAHAGFGCGKRSTETPWPTDLGPANPSDTTTRCGTRDASRNLWESSSDAA